jgi:hypothetical protein
VKRLDKRFDSLLCSLLSSKGSPFVVASRRIRLRNPQVAFRLM